MSSLAMRSGLNYLFEVRRMLVALSEFNHSRQIFRRVGIESLFYSIVNAVEPRRVCAFCLWRPRSGGTPGGWESATAINIRREGCSSGSRSEEHTSELQSL